MVQYHILSIWWPEGWEPRGPSDVPNCAWQTELEPLEPLNLARSMEQDEAFSTVRALNRQVIDATAERWYVVAAVESEPVPPTADEPAEPGIDRYRLHILRPASGAGQGDCTACAAHDLPCATAHWEDEPCILKVARSSL